MRIAARFFGNLVPMGSTPHNARTYDTSNHEKIYGVRDLDITPSIPEKSRKSTSWYQNAGVDYDPRRLRQ